MLVVELLEYVGLELAVVTANGLDDLLALPVGGRLDQIRDLSRMELRQARMKNPQAHRGHIPGEGLDARPVEEVPRCDPAPERAREQPPQSPAATRVHPHDPPPALDSRQFHFIGADEAGSVDLMSW